MKSIRLNRATGQVACFDGTNEIFSVESIKLKIDSEDGLLNYIKHTGSLNAAVEQIKVLN